jgi:hypothetical protein
MWPENLGRNGASPKQSFQRTRVHRPLRLDPVNPGRLTTRTNSRQRKKHQSARGRASPIIFGPEVPRHPRFDAYLGTCDRCAVWWSASWYCASGWLPANRSELRRRWSLRSSRANQRFDLAGCTGFGIQHAGRHTWVTRPTVQRRVTAPKSHAGRPGRVRDRCRIIGGDPVIPAAARVCAPDIQPIGERERQRLSCGRSVQPEQHRVGQALVDNPLGFGGAVAVVCRRVPHSESKMPCIVVICCCWLVTIEWASAIAGGY